MARNKLLAYGLKPWWFIKHVWDNFNNNDGLYRASALTFTTLLTIVPLMSVSVTVLSAFPVFEQYAAPMQDFIFDNFVPATGKVIQAHLQDFASQVTKLSWFGLIFLLVTAVLMLYTIEQALNQIWRVRQRRHGISAFLLYWAILSLTPILMGVSLALSTYLLSTHLLSDTLNQATIVNYLPFMFAAAAFSILYIAVPNCKVPLRYGVAGALVASVLFDITKKLFIYYLKTYDTYTLLYGAFAAVPVFFLWVFYVWVIILIGAEVAHALAIYYERRPGPKLDPFTHAIRWLSYLVRAQQTGTLLKINHLINQDRENYQILPDELLNTLVEAKIVHVSKNGTVIISRDLSQMTVNELRDALPWRSPSYQQVIAYNNPVDHNLAQLIQEFDNSTQDLLQRPVQSLMV